MIREGSVPQERVRLGDIDGDGRLDYCEIGNEGNIFCWRNGGQREAPLDKYDGYWQPMVTCSTADNLQAILIDLQVGDAPTFDSKSMPDIEGVRLIDINGDFRADWVYVYPDGHSRIFVNQRGTIDDGPGLKPAWIEATAAHAGFPGFPNMSRDNSKFGRIFSSGRADYVRVVETPIGGANGSDTERYEYSFEMYQNTGSGGTELKGDGVHYCDMYGRNHDDYLWVGSGG